MRKICILRNDERTFTEHIHVMHMIEYSSCFIRIMILFIKILMCYVNKKCNYENSYENEIKIVKKCLHNT